MQLGVASLLVLVALSLLLFALGLSGSSMHVKAGYSFGRLAYHWEQLVFLGWLLQS